MRKKEKNVDVYACDFPGCAEKEIVGHYGNPMYEIIFGVHTDIHTALNKKGRSVPIIQGAYCFCNKHYSGAREMLFNLISDCSGPNIDRICTKAELVEGLGCWITINNRIDREKVENFQFPFWVFEAIYEIFLKNLSSWQRKILTD